MKLYRFTFTAFSQSVMKMDTETASTKITENKKIVEGLAEISLSAEKVFYNPVQEFNRDLSIAVLNVFIKEYIDEKKALAEKKAQKRTEANLTDSVENAQTEV